MIPVVEPTHVPHAIETNNMCNLQSLEPLTISYAVNQSVDL